MPTLPRRSLFWKYAAYLAGLVSVLLVVSGAVGGYFAYRQSVAALEEVQRAKAQLAATAIENFMRDVQQALRGVVTKFDTTAQVDVEDLRLELVALLRHRPEISELRWIGSDGRESFALSRLKLNAADPARSWLDDPRFLGARQSSNYVGPVYFHKETEPYVWMAGARDPVGSVLVADVNLRSVGDIVAETRLASEGAVYVVDRDGTLISHPDIGLVLRKSDLSTLRHVRQALEQPPQKATVLGETRDMKGHAVVSTVAPIESLGWRVFAEQGLEEAFRPVYASIARSAALVLLGVAAAIVTSILLARRMVRPIREIETRARQLGEGQFDRRIALRTGDELETLAHQFNRMASRLQETHAQQETRIAERTRDLALANEAKTRFLAAASHDLRQPVHALALFVGQLRASNLAGNGHALLQKIEQSVDSLEELLQALFDLSKLDVGAVLVDAKPLPLNGLLSRLTAEFAPSAEAKGLALTFVPTSLWVRSDPLLLQRILLNVISNALRYTVEGRVLLGCRRRGDSVEVIVADTGVGIDGDQLANVFREFYRAAPSRGEAMGDGLGLGLAIVQRLATLLDHRVTIESEPRKGTLVRIRVPRAAPPDQATESPPSVADKLRGTKVLVVDDEAPIREAMQGLLTQWGCDVATAATGDEAVRSALARRPDVVLCDLNLAADEDGVEVVDRLRRECGCPVQCAFVTGEADSDRIARARATGHPIAFKPTAPGKLRAILEHLTVIESPGQPAAAAPAESSRRAHSPSFG